VIRARTGQTGGARRGLSNIVANLWNANWLPLVLAPFIGSFLGVLIKRLPEGRPVIWGRSACQHCGAPLEPRDLVPLVGWLVSRGRCRRCGHPLGWFYPGIEGAAFAIAAIAVAVDGAPQAWLDCLLGWPLLALAWIDIRDGLLPDVLVLPLLVAGLLVTAALDPEDLTDRAAAALLGYVALRLVAELYRRVRHREGLGQGDAKLLAAGGAWLGTVALPQIVVIGALAALAIAAAVRVAGAEVRAHSALPFGPFLAAAIWALWLLGPVPR
jgi:leader peptidase (prepilin peptidase) / N-methyltransferase